MEKTQLILLLIKKHKNNNIGGEIDIKYIFLICFFLLRE